MPDRTRSTPATAARARALAAGLRLDVPSAIDAVAVACCDRHHADGAAAGGAAHELGARLVRLAVGIDPTALRAAVAGSHATVVLACAEATALLGQAPPTRVVVFGDGPGVRWWRLTERRGARRVEPTPTTAAAATAA